MEVYLDNSATTRSYNEVREIVSRVMCEDYGNPSSMHKKGMTAEHYIKESRAILSKLLKVQEKEIIFTGGGTESDNLAVIGGARANHRAGKHLITSAIEHPAVLNAMQHLENDGFRISYLPVDRQGRIQLDALREALCGETILVSIMHVNNEIGSVQPIGEASQIIKAYNKNIMFHVDAVQGFGKYPIHPAKLGIDMLSLSGHKIHGPKGIGALYVHHKVKISPITFGGGQQNDLRPGTENVPGIAGLGIAAKEIYREIDQKIKHMRNLKGILIDGIKKIEQTVIHGAIDDIGAPHIVSAGFAGIPSEVLLHTLEAQGIFVSSGSACASNHKDLSGVLTGIKADKVFLDATVRFSLSEFTTPEEIDYTLETLYNCVPMLRRYTRH